MRKLVIVAAVTILAVAIFAVVCTGTRQVQPSRITVPRAMPAIAATSQNQPQPQHMEGVWQGTIGAQPIRACVNEHEWDTFGAYYYLAHLRTIPLRQPDGQNATFVEGVSEVESAGARWTMDKIEAGSLAGRWSQGYPFN